MNKKLPWYKRVAIWVILIASGFVGALILFFRRFKPDHNSWGPGVPVPPSPIRTREKTDQDLEDKEKEVSDDIERSEKSARSIGVPDNASITDTNRTLAEARERRRIVGYWPTSGGTNRDGEIN